MATINAWHIILGGLALAFAISAYYKVKDINTNRSNNDSTID